MIIGMMVWQVKGNLSMENLLKAVVEFNLPRFNRLPTNKEKASEIYWVCVHSGGTASCNLLTHYENLEGAIFNYLEKRSQLVCSRGACKTPLGHRPYYKIFNEPSTGVPRNYCISCGRKIMEFNLSRPPHEHMKYEIVKGAKS